MAVTRERVPRASSYVRSCTRGHRACGRLVRRRLVYAVASATEWFARMRSSGSQLRFT
jgi:hypothetical protein